MGTVRSIAGQKKARHRLSDDVAGRQSAIGRRTFQSGRVNRLRQGGSKLHADLAASGGNGSNTHCERNLPPRDTLVNKYLPGVEQSVPVSDPAALGRYIRELRGDRMSQAELGRRIGLSRERIGQLESGRVKWPDSDIFNLLAWALEVPVVDLLRRGGAAIPTGSDDEINWVVSQLDDDGVALLAALGRALLPQHRRRPGTAA